MATLAMLKAYYYFLNFRGDLILLTLFVAAVIPRNPGHL